MFEVWMNANSVIGYEAFIGITFFGIALIMIVFYWATAKSKRKHNRVVMISMASVGVFLVSFCIAIEVIYSKPDSYRVSFVKGEGFPSVYDPKGMRVVGSDNDVITCDLVHSSLEFNNCLVRQQDFGRGWFLKGVANNIEEISDVISE